MTAAALKAPHLPSTALRRSGYLRPATLNCRHSFLFARHRISRRLRHRQGVAWSSTSHSQEAPLRRTYTPKILNHEQALIALVDLLHTLNQSDSANRAEWTTMRGVCLYNTLRHSANVLGFTPQIAEWELTGEIALADDEGGVK
jgi:hypothetical protein